MARCAARSFTCVCGSGAECVAAALTCRPVFSFFMRPRLQTMSRSWQTFVMAIDRTSGLRGANFGQTAYHLQRRFGCEVQRPVSALGQKQTFAPQKACLL